MSVLQIGVTNAMKSWKTTVQSVLTCLVSLSTAFAAAPNPYISTKLSAAIALAGMISKVILGMFQTDGQQTSVQLPPGAAVQQTTTIQTAKE